MFVAVLIVVLTLFYNGNLKPGLSSNDRKNTRSWKNVRSTMYDRHRSRSLFTKRSLNDHVKWLKTSILNHRSYFWGYDRGKDGGKDRGFHKDRTKTRSQSKLDYNEHSFDVRLFWFQGHFKVISRSNIGRGQINIHFRSTSGPFPVHFRSIFGQSPVKNWSYLGQIEVKIQFYRHGALLNLGSCKMWIITTVYYLNIWK